MIERLFSSSLIATVGIASPCRLRLWNLKKGTEISSYVYPGHIKALRISQQVKKLFEEFFPTLTPLLHDLKMIDD